MAVEEIGQWTREPAIVGNSQELTLAPGETRQAQFSIPLSSNMQRKGYGARIWLETLAGQDLGKQRVIGEVLTFADPPAPAPEPAQRRRRHYRRLRHPPIHIRRLCFLLRRRP